MTRKVFKKVAKYINNKGTIWTISYHSPNDIYNTYGGKITFSKTEGEYIILEYYTYKFISPNSHKRINYKVKIHRKYINNITLYDENMKYIKRRSCK